jgi:hypothetical protein
VGAHADDKIYAANTIHPASGRYARRRPLYQIAVFAVTNWCLVKFVMAHSIPVLIVVRFALDVPEAGIPSNVRALLLHSLLTLVFWIQLQEIASLNK